MRLQYKANVAKDVAQVEVTQAQMTRMEDLLKKRAISQQDYDNAKAVNDGKRLFGQYNCSGCHSNGGGGMAPALMDDEWIYGGRLDQIHDTIVQGRPNGMPAWGTIHAGTRQPSRTRIT